MTPTILTASGLYFDLLDPEKSDISIKDIAHGLSHICRFTGHVHTFYSVAEHSYHASYLVPPEHALAALLHDAAEAYLGDVSSPLKHQLHEYKVIETNVELAIRRRFRLPLTQHACIKHADRVMLATEKRDLMPAHRETWSDLLGIEPMPMQIIPMTSAIARQKFFDRFMELWDKGVHLEPTHQPT